MPKSKTPMQQLVADDEGILPFESRLRHNILKMPAEIQKASGIVIFGRRIKSLLFSTDLAIIKNCDADAVFAVHPFTAQRSISHPIIQSANMPVFCGVGGGTTQGIRAVYLANDAESQGAIGVVLKCLNRMIRKTEANGLLSALLCSCFGGLLAALAVKTGLGQSVEMISIGNIMLLIPGIALTNSLRDMFSGNTMSGMLRFLEAIIMALVIALGFALVAELV